MPGVRFDRASAKRIGDAVRKIEHIPGGEEDLQRRRAGGLGRSTLWEVTAVQTGPGTVTIKRVSNISFDLNDPSEKEDVLYDPDLEPSEGDRGLLIRLGEGDLFFFRRDIIVRIPITEVARVDDATPDANDGYWPLPGGVLPMEKTRSWSPGGTHEERLAFKLAKQLPASASLPSEATIQLYSKGWIVVTLLATAPRTDNLHIGLYIRPILDDFTPSTLTWNQLAGLTKGSTHVVLLGSGLDIEIQTALLSGQLQVIHDLVGSLFSHAGTKTNWGEAYGIEVFFFDSLPTISWKLDGIRSFQMNSNTSFIEWVA